MLRELWNRWVRIALAIGEFNSRVVLTVFYYLVLGPTGLCLRVFSDPLCLISPKRITWSSVTPSAEDKLAAARRQF